MKDYWNRLFAERAVEFSHEEYLEEDIALFRGKDLLDIGSGDGRNAFFFSRKGYDVTCLDYSESGIRKITEKAQRIGIPVKTRIADVFTDSLEEMENSFDTIAMIHFFPDLTVLEKLMTLLRNDGLLYCLTFVKDDYEEGNSRYEIGISTEEIDSLYDIYKIVKKGCRTDPRGRFYFFAIQKK